MIEDNTTSKTPQEAAAKVLTHVEGEVLTICTHFMAAYNSPGIREDVKERLSVIMAPAIPTEDQITLGVRDYTMQLALGAVHASANQLELLEGTPQACFENGNKQMGRLLAELYSNAVTNNLAYKICHTLIASGKDISTLTPGFSKEYLHVGVVEKDMVSGATKTYTIKDSDIPPSLGVDEWPEEVGEA